ncbi:hypothetical protein PG994_001628 [Apiospora phragmitis]|uniref:VWFA domain-containing protein n=1 Tax=Apiospora phragmitis TaxID=2905665 RepID=A0ABR1WU52_9PEZI
MDPLVSSKRSSRFSLSRLNLFASKEDASAQSPKGSSSSISRSQSRKSTNQPQQQQPQKPATTTSSAAGPPPADPPPAYTETKVSSSGASTRNPTTSRIGAYQGLSAANISTEDDEFAFLSSFDTVFLIDDSGSMTGDSWAEVRGVLREIVPTCVAHDSDGVDVYFLNHRSSELLDKGSGKAGTGYRGVTNAEGVAELFRRVRPSGGTPTGQRLGQILRPYLNRYRKVVDETEDVFAMKPLNIIVITDGAAGDDPEDPIVFAAKELDELRAPGYQIGIQFFQVGDYPEAAKALKALDDDLPNKGVRDIVDTCYFQAGTKGRITSQKLLKVVLGAVDKRIDKNDTRTAEAKRR